MSESNREADNAVPTFATLLGTPRVWELAINTTKDPNFGNTTTDIMGSSGPHLPIMSRSIRSDVKKAMGL